MINMQILMVRHVKFMTKREREDRRKVREKNGRERRGIGRGGEEKWRGRRGSEERECVRMIDTKREKEKGHN